VLYSKLSALHIISVLHIIMSAKLWLFAAAVCGAFASELHTIPFSASTGLVQPICVWVERKSLTDEVAIGAATTGEAEGCTARRTRFVLLATDPKRRGRCRFLVEGAAVVADIMLVVLLLLLLLLLLPAPPLLLVDPMWKLALPPNAKHLGKVAAALE
jgi:hypothetical protein